MILNRFFKFIKLLLNFFKKTNKMKNITQKQENEFLLHAIKCLENETGRQVVKIEPMMYFKIVPERRAEFIDTTIDKKFFCISVDIPSSVEDLHAYTFTVENLNDNSIIQEFDLSGQLMNSNRNREPMIFNTFIHDIYVPHNTSVNYPYISIIGYYLHLKL